ncbi:MAG: haloacid dehalogenase [Chloroflexi bacterium]|nr:haloacid dehalogenase [Chloroflexota bacterium]MCL5076103.1 haloacid dehalogenase [Chloroflexota bacterium]
MPELKDIVEKIRLDFEAKNAAREDGLSLSRKIARASANAIRAVHRGEFPEAIILLSEAGQSLAQVREILRSYPDVLYAGFVHDAAKEYVEASVTYALITGQDLPDPDTLGVDYPAYLNGLGEATGELRRYILDCLRRGDTSRCEHLLQAMDDIYGLLFSIDHPDAVTAGLRRTTDAVRGIVEKTRGDFTVAYRQSELESNLAEFQKAVGRLKILGAGE